MNRFVFLCIQALMLRTTFSLPTPGNAYLSNLNNPASISQTPFTNTFSETNILSNNGINNSIMLSGLNANAINNNVLASAVSGVPNPAISNIQVSPVISELVPSLQYGDINMVGDLPIGGTIKVSGCFPVYGMISVDGNVPSSGTAVVSESIGNQVIDVVNKCANQYFS